jgi:hypothetical protein
MIPCSNCGHLEENSRFDPVSSSNPRQQLAELDLEIARIEAYLHDLQSKKPSLKRQLNHIVAPVLQLPPDIFSEIFLCCIDKDWENPRFTTSPFALGSICGTWRDLVWSMPWLWNKVKVIRPWPSASRCTLLEGWLARAGDYPLSIQLRGDHKSFIAHILNIFLRFSERWNSFIFDIPYECFHTLAVETRLPLLTSVDFCLSHKLVQKIQAFSAAPQLQAVTLRGVPLLSLVDLPIHQLTKLAAAFRDSNECLDVLGRASRLSIGSILLYNPAQCQNTVAPLVVTQLQSLSLTSGSSISPFLDALCLPSIHTLHFNAGRTNLVFPHTSFLSLMHRSSCSLTKFDLDYLSFSDVHLLQCLRAVPLLRELALRNTNAGAGTFRMLNPDHALDFSYTGPLLPNLQAFVFANHKDGFSLHGDLIDMLSSRWDRNGFAHLRLVAITTSRSLSSSTHAQEIMQHLVSQGMDIRIAAMY